MEQPAQAEFNSGLAIIYQLDAIEKGMTQATIDKDYAIHYKFLLAYFKTLYPHMKREVREEQMIRFKQMRNNYNTVMLARNKVNAKVPAYLIDDFDDWELELRSIKQKHGLGMPEKDLRYQPGRGR